MLILLEKYILEKTYKIELEIKTSLTGDVIDRGDMAVDKNHFSSGESTTYPNSIKESKFIYSKFVRWYVYDSYNRMFLSKFKSFMLSEYREIKDYLTKNSEICFNLEKKFKTCLYYAEIKRLYFLFVNDLIKEIRKIKFYEGYTFRFV